MRLRAHVAIGLCHWFKVKVKPRVTRTQIKQSVNHHSPIFVSGEPFLCFLKGNQKAATNFRASRIATHSHLSVCVLGPKCDPAWIRPPTFVQKTHMFNLPFVGPLHVRYAQNYGVMTSMFFRLAFVYRNSGAEDLADLLKEKQAFAPPHPSFFHSQPCWLLMIDHIPVRYQLLMHLC